MGRQQVDVILTSKYRAPSSEHSEGVKEMVGDTHSGWQSEVPMPTLTPVPPATKLLMLWPRRWAVGERLFLILLNMYSFASQQHACPVYHMRELTCSPKLIIKHFVMYAHVKFEYTMAFCEEAINSLIKFPEKLIKSVSFQMCKAIVFLFAGFT